MQAIKLNLHQHNAVYRNPASGEIVESYPLFPPSTFLGLISSILKKQELTKGSFNLSIQGTYAALIRDYQWYKKYDDRTNAYRAHRYPLLIHTLFDVDLLVHVYSHDSTTLNQLLQLFKNPPYFLYLGRAEDIVKIIKSEIVNIDKITLSETYRFPLNAYVSNKDAQRMNIGGVLYNLPTYSKFVPFTINKQSKLIRDFEWESLVYVEKGTRIEADEDSELEECWSDGENLIWWSLPNLPQ